MQLLKFLNNFYLVVITRRAHLAPLRSTLVHSSCSMLLPGVWILVLRKAEKATTPSLMQHPHSTSSFTPPPLACICFKSSPYSQGYPLFHLQPNRSPPSLGLACLSSTAATRPRPSSPPPPEARRHIVCLPGPGYSL